MKTAQQLSRNKHQTSLRRMRLSHGLKLADVAEQTGIDIPRLSMLETGVQNPSDEAARALAKFYGTTVDALFPRKVRRALRKMEGR